MIRRRVTWIVLRREVVDRVRSRGFRVSTALLLFGAVAGVAAGSLLPGLIEGDPHVIGLAGDAGSAPVRDAVAASAEQLDVEVVLRGQPGRAAGEAALRAGTIDALLVDRGPLVFDRTVDGAVAAVVRQALLAESLPERLGAAGLTFEAARPLIDPPPLATERLRPDPADDAETAGDAGARRALSTAAVGGLYLALALYGNWILMGVVEEKTSRVVEVLLGTLRPAELLAGKVLGILAVALLQGALLVGAVVLALSAVGDVELPDAAPDVALVAGVWVVLGLLFYNFAYAAVGATVSRQADAAGAAWPVIVLLLVPYAFGLMYVPEHPDALITRIASLVPLTAPLVMPARVAAGDPAAWEIVAGPLLMLPAIAGMVWLAGRVYAGAILRSGGRVGLLRALRSSRDTV